MIPIATRTIFDNDTLYSIRYDIDWESVAIEESGLSRTGLTRIADYVRTGIETDGAHHKQWCLMQIAKVLELQGIDTLDEGTAP
jgi:hypothetical protein